ncbi:MAG: HD domain-containing protein [Deferribacterales bacterium]|nr:HD domain-containing protein [Deferribacterales bacterium]
MDFNIKKKYMIFSIVNALTKDNHTYYRMVFSDTEGATVNAIMFDVKKLKFTPEKGIIVDVTGVLQTYNGASQLKVFDMEKVDGANTDEFLPKSDKDAKEMGDELKKILDKHIKSSYFKELANKFLNDENVFGNFLRKPAAKSVHHAYIHGLLEHTLSMMKLSILIADYYGKDINKELLLMGALFHDSGKIMEIDSDNAFDYTDEGKLLGHLILGMELVNRYVSEINDFPEKARQLVIHMIASHHGYLEFGSPKKPKTKEAMILHFVDNLDAKLATMDSVFEKEDIKAGGWSSYDRILERHLYKHDLYPET